MASITTSVAGVSITEVSGDSNVRIQEMVDSTTSALKMFPSLNSIPDILIYCMNTWQAESGFEQFHKDGTSRHNTIVTGLGSNIYIPEDTSTWVSGKGFGTHYWVGNPLKHLRKSTPSNPPQPGLVDGLYAHGISACMGAYSVIGTNTYQTTFGLPKYKSICTSNGLLVDPTSLVEGARITNLFPDNKAGRYSSIVAGLVILDSKYSAVVGKLMTKYYQDALNKIGESATIGKPITQRQAIILACGLYVGSLAGKDANNYSPISRMQICRDNRTWTYKADTNARNNPNTTKTATTGKEPGCMG